MENIISQFGLTADQTCLLFSLEYKIIHDQVLKESDTDRRKRKQEWEFKWLSIMANSLIQLKSEHGVLTDITSLRNLRSEINNESKSKAWKYMILLECSLFDAFYPLGTTDQDKDLVKRLKNDKDCFHSSLIWISNFLDIDEKYITIFQKEYKSALNKLTNHTLKMVLFIGFGAIIAALLAIVCQPALVSLLAAEGIYGAAASASVMAMLGGGAIAAGGLGIAGGWAVLVGGGFLVGGSLGASAFMLSAKSNSDFVLTQAARLEVVLKEIIMGMQNDVKTFQEILMKQQEQIAAMKAELIRLQKEESKHKDEIKNLKKSIEYLERLCKML